MKIIALYPALAKDAGQRVPVAEGVAFPINLDLVIWQAKFFLEETPRIQQVAAQAFAGSHVLVAFHPLAGSDFPAALGDAFLNALV